MSTTPTVPVPTPAVQAPLQVTASPTAPQTAGNFQQASPTTQAQPSQHPAVPVAPQAQPSPQEKIAQGARKATAVLSQAANSLPQMVGQHVQQHDTMTKLRDKQVIDLVANSHVAMVAATDKIQTQLKPLAEQLDQHMKEAQALPASDPTKTGRIGYLAHIYTDVVKAMKDQMQVVQQAQQTIQAQMAEPKNRKLLSKAVGYDEKQANSPERQMMIAALNAGMQKIKQGAEKVVAALPPPVPQAQPQNARLYNNGAPQTSQSTATMVVANPKGLIEPGNLQIWNRPVVQNADGTHSSEYSVSFSQDGKEVLVPTVANGRFLTPDGKKPPEGSAAEKAMFKAAWDHYLQTGEHLGKFDNAADADAYAEILHNRQDPLPISAGPGLAGGGLTAQEFPQSPQPRVVKGAAPWSEMTGKQRLGRVLEILGTIAMPQQMAMFPGTAQNRMMLQQRTMALQKQILDMQKEQSGTELARAQAGAEEPWQQKQKDIESQAQAQREEAMARLAEAHASQLATQAYRQSSLDLRNAEFDAKNDPNNLQNKFKLEQLRIESERAQAAMQQLAQTQEGLQNLAQMVIDHQVAPAQLPTFGVQRGKVLALVNKMDPRFNAAATDIAYRYANNPSTQNTLNYLESLTGADNQSGNLGIVIQMSDSLPRGKYPAINRPELWAKLQAGNPQIAAYYAAVAESADQVAKIMQGGGTGNATSDAKLKQAVDLFNKGFNSDQIKSVAVTLRDLLDNRKSALIGRNPFLQQQFGQGEQVGASATNWNMP